MKLFSPAGRHAVVVGLAMLLATGLLTLQAPAADAQTPGPTIASLSVVDGAILSPAATPKLFPNGSGTLFLRGRVGARATIVQLRIEDFWSGREWHPETSCRQARVGRTCPAGTMTTGMRFSRADVNPVVTNGTKSFTYRAQLPNGMYRVKVFARTSRNGSPGIVETRWFRVHRPASADAARARVLTRSPANNATATLTDRFVRTPIRIVSNTASTRLHWALRNDATGRFYKATRETVEACPQRWGCRFQPGAFYNRRDFTGWQSAQGGRVFFDWTLPLLPGEYTMWTIGVNSNAKKGPVSSHSFTVTSPSVPNPTISFDDNGEIPTGETLFSGTSGDAGSSAASPSVSLSLYDIGARGFVSPDGTVGTFQPLGALVGPANDWVARLDLKPGNYRLRVRSTWPDGATLQSPAKTISVGPCPAAGCPRARLGEVDIETRNRTFDFELASSVFDQSGSGKWAMLRVSDGLWFNATRDSFGREWTLNNLGDRGNQTAGPATGTPKRLARGDYFIGIRLFNADGEQGDVRWVGFTVD